MEITWRDKKITCEEGTTLFDISKQVEKEYEFPIIVAKVDGVIQEVSLLSLTEYELYLKIPYLILVFGLIILGILGCIIKEISK